MRPDDKWRCRECNEISIESALLSAPNPFDTSDRIAGCPFCKGVDGFDEICDEPQCEQRVSCGTPTRNGYRRTCSEHHPDRKVKQ